MTWNDIAALIIAACTLINTFALLPFAIVRACQARDLAKKIHKKLEAKS